MSKTEAYICAIIENDGDTLVRILNLTPGVSQPVHLASYAKFKELVKNGLDMPGISYSKYSDDLEYYGKAVRDMFPVLKSTRAHSKKLIAIRAIYHADGMHELIVATDAGNLKRTYISALLNDESWTITNIEFKEVAYPGRYATGLRGSRLLAPFLPDGRLIDTLGVPKNSDIDTVNDKLFNDFVSEEYFQSEMLARGLRFVYQDCELSYIDRNIEVLNPPVGCTTINLKEAAEAKPFKKVFIPNSVYYLTNLSDNRLTDRRIEFIYEPRYDTDRIEVYALNKYVSKSGDHYIPNLVPTNISSIIGLFDSSTYADADLSVLKNLDYISHGFSGIELNEHIIKLPRTLKSMSYCFSHVVMQEIDGTDIVDGSVKFYDNITKINSSFKEVEGLAYLDFSEAVNLENIDQSFKSLMDVEVIDLSKCTKLTNLYDSFMRLPKLKEVKLPPNLERIGMNCFSECPLLEKIELPDSLIAISGGAFNDTGITDLALKPSIEVAYDLSNVNVTLLPRKTLGTKLVSEYGIRYRSFNIMPGLEEIEGAIFKNTNLANIVFPDTIKKIDKKVFYRSKLDGLFDMQNWEVTSIPEECFFEAFINKIVLPKNTKTIDKGAFGSAGSLAQILIPESITDIHRTAFDKAGSKVPGGTELLVIRGSYGETYAKRFRLRNTVYDTYESAYDAIRGLDTLSSEKAQLKAKLLGSASQDEIIREITSEAYVQNSQILMNLYKTLKNEVDYSAVAIKLDMSKIKGLFRVADIRDAFYETMPNDVYTILCAFDDSNMSTVGKPSDLSNHFKIMANLITTSTESIDFVNNAENISKILNANKDYFLRGDLNFRIICNDKMSGIYYVKLRLRNEVDTYNIRLILIRIGTNIVYSTAYLQHNEQHQPMTIMAEAFTHTDMQELAKSTLNLTGAIKVGDVICLKGYNANTIMSKVIIPKSMRLSVAEAVRGRFMPVCGYCMKGKYNDMLVDILDGTIYSVSAVASDSIISDITSYENFLILGKTNINNLTKENIRFLKLYSFYQNKVEDLLKTMVNPELLIDELRGREGAFDELEPCLEWGISKLMNEAGVFNIENLNYTFMLGILSTAYFKRVAKNKDDIQLNRLTKITLKDGAEICTTRFYSRMKNKGSQIVGYMPNYISFLLKKGEAISENMTCFISESEPKDIVKSIGNIYSSKGSKYTYVEESEANRSEFILIWRSNISSYESYSGIYMNRSNGLVYYGVEYKQKLYLVFRFKNLEMAVKYGKLHFDEGMLYGTKTHAAKVPDIEESVSNIANNLSRNGNAVHAMGSGVKPFIYMIEGYPNGYRLSGTAQIIWELIAKQPKRPDDI